MEQSVQVKMAELEERVEGNTRRIEGLERGQKALNRLATAVEVLATKQTSMGKSVEQLSAKMDQLESRPQRRWEDICDKLVVAALSAILGWLMAQMGVLP